jgi:hypothetical protein
MITTTGLPQLIKKFADLKNKHIKAALRKGTRAGAKRLAVPIRSQLAGHSKTGITAASVKVRAMKRSRVRIGAMVQVRAISTPKTSQPRQAQDRDEMGRFLVRTRLEGTEKEEKALVAAGKAAARQKYRQQRANQKTGQGVPYPQFVELGDKHLQAQHRMRNASTQGSDSAMRACNETAALELEKAAAI